MIAFSHFKKVLIMFLAIFIVIFSLSAPYSTGNIDRLAYVIALGLDVGDNNDLKLSVQLSKSENSSGGSSGNSPCRTPSRQVLLHLCSPYTNTGPGPVCLRLPCPGNAQGQ